MKSGRISKSRSVGGLYHLLNLPVFGISSRPKGPRGAKGLDKTKISHSFVLDKGLDQAIQNVKNAGFRKVKSTQLTYRLPAWCPKCERREGHPVCNYDDRGYGVSHREVPVPPLRIWWNHNKPKDRHLIGTLVVSKKGPISFKPTKGISHKKMLMGYFVKKYGKDNVLTGPMEIL